MAFARQAALPDWLAIVQHELGGGGKDGRSDLLMPSAVLDEIAAIVVGVRLGHGRPHPRHWRSLTAELDRVATTFGPAVGAVAMPRLERLRRALPREPPPGERADELASELEDARAALHDPSLRQAAWDDVLAAFQDGIDPETAAVRLRLLRDLVEVADADWDRVANALTGALNDDAFALQQMGHEIPVQVTRLQDAAGWRLDERLRACRGYLAHDAARGSLIAWVCFEQAFLPQLYLPLGPAELWAGHAYPGGLTSSNWRKAGPPPELQNDRHALFLPKPSDDPWVLMRLELGERPSAGAAEHARSLAVTIVQMASAASGWRLMPGCALVRDGHWWGGTIHPTPPTIAAEARYEPTAQQLGDLDASLVQGLVERLPEVEEVASDVRWVESLHAISDPAQRLALAIRLLERRLPPAGAPQAGWGSEGSWMARTRWWLREAWAARRLAIELRDAALEGVHGLTRWGAPQSMFLDYKQRMLPDTGELSFHAMLGEIARGLDDLAVRIPDWEMTSRIVRFTAAQVADGPSARARLELHATAFDALLGRAARVRNAVLHGNDTVPAVVASVEPMIIELAQHVISAELFALTASTGLHDVLDDGRERRQRNLKRLENGDPPADALFAPD